MQDSQQATIGNGLCGNRNACRAYDPAFRQPAILVGVGPGIMACFREQQERGPNPRLFWPPLSARATGEGCRCIS
jgi:hypothetical protein